MSAAEVFTLVPKRVPKWKANGKMDYARSVRKWEITPSAQTTFFMREGRLLRTLKPAADGLIPENEPIPSFTAAAAPAEAPATGDAAPAEGKKNPVQQIFAIFNRRKAHHHKAPKGQSSVAAKPEAGESEVPADDVQNDQEYVVPVMIGTPGVTLNLDFDTGSSDLWVWGPTIATGGTTHTVYNHTASSTAKIANGLTWNISYGDGSSASGDVYTDVVTLGQISIPGQAVEVAEKLSSAFTSDVSDGLLGLAFPTINTVTPTQQLTPVANMIKEKLVEQPLFTVKLDKEDSKGFYTFGGLATAAAVGVTSVSDITYTDIISSNGFWEFYSPSLTIGTTTSKREANNTAIADTGTTLLLLSDAACSLIYRQISGAKMDASAGGWIFPTTATPPNLSFGVGTTGLEYGIPGEDLKFADAGNGMSFGAVQSRGGNPQDILGDVFLKRVYAIFNQTTDAPKIAFIQRPFN